MIEGEHKDDILDFLCPWCKGDIIDEDVEFFKAVAEVHCETCGRPVIIHRITTISYCAVADD